MAEIIIINSAVAKLMSDKNAFEQSMKVLTFKLEYVDGMKNIPCMRCQKPCKDGVRALEEIRESFANTGLSPATLGLIDSLAQKISGCVLNTGS
jgi:hypothetical protein